MEIHIMMCEQLQSTSVTSQTEMSFASTNKFAGDTNKQTNKNHKILRENI